ncbi:amidohydrolase family protein [Gracilibacillus caseinilyticus]|uniref:Amidohydrolase family protein n=1 Tax=Gracilibacillus caseinilyticus TaxID=2932256 RepID=A0ABY4EZT1_9BACI|nr:amidohydrolase family protein [Gracilibacillus caseinilyticus]UOQ49911.1 amidohydrolase family protein [Gracilibacillus caseinilyticus]
MFDTVINNVRLLNMDDVVNVGINDGRFAKIAEEKMTGQTTWNGRGFYLLPPFVETHTHMDTVLTAGSPRFNLSGTLFEAIEVWQERKQNLTVEDVFDRACQALQQLLSYGVLFVRAAVDISDSELTALQALVKVKKYFTGKIDLEIIAFPQDGLMASPDNQKRMRQALEWGADLVSAAPHLEPTREKGIESLRFCFQLAQEWNKAIHIFCDEVDDEHSRFLEVVADLAISKKYDLVTVSHANALAYYNDVYASKVIRLVQQANITVVACPLVNSMMQGRADRYPKGRGMTRVKQLHDAGVNVCMAHDDIRTPFYPLGTGNILQAAHLGLHLAHMSGQQDLHDVVQMITVNGATCLDIHDRYGIEEGKPANGVVLPANDLAILLSEQPKPMYVFRNGELLSETDPVETTFYYEKMTT